MENIKVGIFELDGVISMLYENCMAAEDTISGVEAAHAAGMKVAPWVPYWRLHAGVFLSSFGNAIRHKVRR